MIQAAQLVPKTMIFAVCGSLVIYGPACKVERNTGDISDDITLNHLERLRVVIDAYHRSAGLWPTSKSDVINAVKDTNIFFDGWGKEVHFITNARTPNMLWVESYGADGLPGGTGTNSDIIISFGISN